MNRGLIYIALFALAALASSPARSEIMANQSGLLRGQQSFVFAMNVSGPGTFTVNLTDLNWQGRLENLSFALSGPDGLVPAALNPRIAATSPMEVFNATGGTKTFSVKNAGLYFGYLSGQATGPYGLGLYSLNVDFAADAAAVPLPASAWMLLAGMAGLYAAARARKGGESLFPSWRLLPAAA